MMGKRMMSTHLDDGCAPGVESHIVAINSNTNGHASQDPLDC